MFLDDIKANLQSVYGKIKKPVDTLVEKVKRQDLRVPTGREFASSATALEEKLFGGLRRAVAPKPLERRLGRFEEKGGIIRKAPRLGLGFLGLDPETQLKTRKAQQLLADVAAKKGEKFVPEKQVTLSMAKTESGKGFSDKTLREELSPEDYKLVKNVMANETVNIGSMTSGLKAVPRKLDPKMAKNLLGVIDDISKTRTEQDILNTATRKAKSARLLQISKKLKGSELLARKKQILSGEFEKVGFVSPKWTQADMDTLIDFIERDEILRPFEKANVQSALYDLFTKGGLPTRSQIKLIRKTLPREVANNITSLTTNKLAQLLDEGINIPRAMMSTADLSAPFRQGWMLISKPKQWLGAFKDMFKFAASEEAYDDLYRQITQMDTYPQMVDAGLDITDMANPMLSGREEAFRSELAEKVPGFGSIVKASNRAYTGFLNKLRVDVFDDMLKASRASGVPQTDEFLKSLGRWVNTATGRGDLGAFKQASGALSTAIFSPKLLKSRFDVLNPVYYARLDPWVRKEALKTVFATTAMTLSMLALADMVPGVEVGKDPRSADFGKIKIGNTRYDLTGGFQQYFVLLARQFTNELVSSTTGKKVTLGEGFGGPTRLSIFADFFGKKTSPFASFVGDWMRGKDTLGKPFDLPTEVIDRLTPMVVSDLWDMYKQGELGFFGWLPSFFGVSTQTYGKQQLTTGVDMFGNITAEIEQPKDLSQTIREGIFGKIPLQKTRASNLELYREQIMQLPAAEARAELQKLEQENPELFSDLMDLHRRRKAGITVQDEALRGKGVQDGSRAKAVIEELNKVPAGPERKALYDSYVQKKVITPEVREQIIKLLQQERQ